MGLVDEHVVDPGLVEGDAVQSPLVFSNGLGPLLQADDVGFQPLHTETVFALRLALCGSVLGDLGLAVGDLGIFGHPDALEGAVGDDHCVPVSGGTSGDKLLHGVFAGGLLRRHQDVGQGIGLEELGAELLQHVVRHHVGRLGHQSQSLHLHASDDHGGGLACPDGVAEQDRRLLDGAPGGVQLVRVRAECSRQAGEALVTAIPGGKHHRVEQFVVAATEPLGPHRVLPHPGGKAIGECLLLLSRQQGRLRVKDPAPVAIGVIDGDRGLVERLGEQTHPVCPIGPPVRGHRHRLLLPGRDADRPGCVDFDVFDRHLARTQDLSDECGHVGRLDPGDSRSGVDLFWCQVLGEDAFQRHDVDREARVVRRRQ